MDVFKETTIEDDFWRCTVVLVFFQSQRLLNLMYKVLKDLPDNITIITKEVLNREEKTNRNTHSSLKSKKTNKHRERTVKSISKTNKSAETKQIEQTSSEKEENSHKIETCLKLKKFIIGLKMCDMRNNFNHISKTNNRSNDEPTTKEKDKIINHRFIILWDFHYDDVTLGTLLTLGVLVKAVINVKENYNENGSTSKNDLIIKTMDENKSSKNDKNIKDTRFANDYTTSITDINNTINDHSYLDYSKDVLLLDFIPQVEKQDKFAQHFQNILLYVNEAWTSFEKYCGTVVVNKILSQNIVPLEDYNLYTTMISMIPQESINISLVLHCLVEQVVWLVYDSNSGKNGDEKSFETCSATYQKNPFSSTVFENITPIIIEENDLIRYSTFDLILPEFNFENISRNILSKNPIYNLWYHYPSLSLAQSKFYEFQLTKLQACANFMKCNTFLIMHLHQAAINVFVSNFYQVITNSEDISMKNGSFIKVNNDYGCFSGTSLNSKLVPDIYFKRTDFENIKNKSNLKKPIENKSSNPDNERLQISKEQKETKSKRLEQLKAFLHCPDLSQLHEEIRNLEVNSHLTDHTADMKFVKEYNQNTMCQSLQEAFQSFLNVYYVYFALTDSILLWFHNIAESDIKSSNILGTVLGFRDFYKYKLKGELTFQSLGDSNVFGGIQETLKNKSTCETNIVYDLGPLQMEVTETVKQFVSPDTSLVTVRYMKYFHNKPSFLVTVYKNSTILSYEFYPQLSQKDLHLLITLSKGMIVNCHLNWSVEETCGDFINDIDRKMENNTVQTLISSNTQSSDYNHVYETIPQTENTDQLHENNSARLYQVLTNSKIEGSTDEFMKINCNLSISLPSGLLVEVVTTDSLCAPFYIRQRYVSKGPSSGIIWKETQRCYLNNGSILIFYVDGTVDILYSNGTRVKCYSFDLAPCKTEGLSNKQENLEKELISTEKPKIRISKKTSLKEKNKNRKKEEIVKQNAVEMSISKKSREKKINIAASIIEDDDKRLPQETNTVQTNSVMLFNITHHSVLSVEGEYKEFLNNKQLQNVTRNTLKAAFDFVNQELYMLRNDGMTSFFTPENLTVTFPDGSKVTSFTEDNRKQYHCDFGETINSDVFVGTMGSHVGKSELTVTNETATSTASHSSTNSNEDIGLNETYVFVDTIYTLEHQNYATVIYRNNSKDVELKFPHNISINFNMNKLFYIRTEDNDNIKIYNDRLVFDGCVVENTQLKSVSTLYFKNISTSPRIICETLDSFGNKYVVNCRGDTELIRGQIIVGKPQLRYPENKERFFVFKRDLTGYEMIRKQEILHNVVKVPLSKNHDICSMYTQTPILKNISEQFLMNFEQERVLPKLIKRKDLFNVDNDSLSVWFNPAVSSVTVNCNTTKERKLPPLPKAMMFKQLLIFENQSTSFEFMIKLLKTFVTQNEQIIERYCNEGPKDQNNPSNCGKPFVNILDCNNVL